MLEPSGFYFCFFIFFFGLPGFFDGFAGRKGEDVSSFVKWVFLRYRLSFFFYRSRINDTTAFVLVPGLYHVPLNAKPSDPQFPFSHFFFLASPSSPIPSPRTILQTPAHPCLLLIPPLPPCPNF